MYESVIMAQEFNRLKCKRADLRIIVSKLLKEVHDSLASEDRDNLSKSLELLLEITSSFNSLKELDVGIHELC